MNDELKNEILKALQALREGAPDAWAHLCGEVVARGYANLLLGLLVLVLAVALATCASRRIRAKGGVDDESGWMLVVVPVLAVPSVLSLHRGLTAIVAPSLELLGR